MGLFASRNRIPVSGKKNYFKLYQTSTCHQNEPVKVRVRDSSAPNPSPTSSETRKILNLGCLTTPPPLPPPQALQLPYLKEVRGPLIVRGVLAPRGGPHRLGDGSPSPNFQKPLLRGSCVLGRGDVARL